MLSVDFIVCIFPFYTYVVYEHALHFLMNKMRYLEVLLVEQNQFFWFFALFCWFRSLDSLSEIAL